MPKDVDVVDEEKPDTEISATAQLERRRVVTLLGTCAYVSTIELNREPD
jgi:hypothetical protein